MAENHIITEQSETINNKRKSRLRSAGPGIISGSSGNDAGGIATYSSIGAAYGYKLLYLMMISIPMLVVVHDMCARISSTTKKGIGSMIRKRYGARIAIILVIALFVSNVAVVAANVAGMSVALQLITEIDYRFFIIPLTLLVWFLVTKGTYVKVEKVLIGFSLGLLAYIIVAFISNPSLLELLFGTFLPHIEISGKFFLTAVGMIGATVSPYIYYYYTSAELEVSKSDEEMNECRFGAKVGALWCGIVAYFIILTAAAVLFTAGINDINTAHDAALALKPLAGDFAFMLFAVGLFAASMIATAVLPIATAYGITETFGMESGVAKKLDKAKMFYAVFTISLVLGAGLILIGLDPIQTMLISMVISGILTPIIVFILMKICNDKEILGKYTNGRIANIIGWLTVAISAALVIAMFITLVFPI
ncbi:MAG: divalent metal cation transporter [Candidatus Aenigmarchaeota archaeon]|nr:divalent metal cation transporter [Candidatus Aenigmarchaeota archaeon]